MRVHLRPLARVRRVLLENHFLIRLLRLVEVRKKEFFIDNLLVRIHFII